MMSPLSLLMFAQGAAVGTIAYWAIAILVIGGVIGIMFVVLKQAGIAVPQFVWTILCILFAVIIGVMAIRFLVGM